MPVELSDEEVEVVRALLHDWGFEYGLTADREGVVALMRKLELEKLAKDWEA